MDQLDRSSYVPLYLQILRQLRSELGSRWLPGDRFPSDHEVAAQYQVSRVTARQAIATLVQEGLLERRRGSGTYVTPPRTLGHDLSSNLDSSEQWLMQKAGLTRQLIAIEEAPCPFDVAIRLNLQHDDPVLHFVRVRSIEGRRIAVDDRYLPLAIGRRLRPEWLEGGTLSRILPEQLGIPVGNRVREFQAAGADQAVSAWLEVPLGTPVLQVRTLIISPARDPLMAGTSYYRGEDVSFRHVTSG